MEDGHSNETISSAHLKTRIDIHVTSEWPFVEEHNDLLFDYLSEEMTYEWSLLSISRVNQMSRNIDRKQPCTTQIISIR